MTAREMEFHMWEAISQKVLCYKQSYQRGAQNLKYLTSAEAERSF